MPSAGHTSSEAHVGKLLLLVSLHTHLHTLQRLAARVADDTTDGATRAHRAHVDTRTVKSETFYSAVSEAFHAMDKTLHAITRQEQRTLARPPLQCTGIGWYPR